MVLNLLECRLFLLLMLLLFPIMDVSPERQEDCKDKTEKKLIFLVDRAQGTCFEHCGIL